ncbi:hypothetical protein H0H92_000914 [Tricholoma furcatifolium]|nr:hypothetical protein H0H92_000914 [Tricholoma furcatifolium]
MSQEPEDVKPKLNLNIGYEGTRTFKFTYDGQRIQGDDTPASLGMEDGDQIDAFLEQTMNTAEDYDANFCYPVKDLESERVKLTLFQPSKHAEEFYKISRPTYDYLPYGPYDTVEDFVSGLFEGLIQPNLGNALFAVFDKTKASELGNKDGAFAGVIGYTNGMAHYLAVEIAWVLISPQFQRTHVTSNAVGLLLKYALDLPEAGGLGLRRVVWQCSPANGPSIKAAERMGFKREGYSRWTMVMPEGKPLGNGRDRRAGDPKKHLLGRDTQVLGICWDDWESGSSLQRHLAFVATDSINWKFGVQAVSWTVTLFETYLLLRQYPLYSKTQPPAALAEHFEVETFQKSQNYGRDKAKFALISGLIKQSLDSIFLHFGFYPWSWDVAGRLLTFFGYGAEYESIVFVFVLYFLSTIPTLPLSVYGTFVLEEKHGFNKTTPGLFVADIFKGWGLAIALGSPFLAAFLYIFQWAGDRFVPWVMAFMITFQLTMVIVYPTVIQPMFNKLSPLAPGELRTRIEQLATKLHFPLKHLYEIDGSKRSSHSNAYFFGLPWSKHIVIFDTLIQQSKPEEVEAVLAHELGHWYYLHPTKMMVISQLHIFTVLALFPAFLHAPPVLASFGFPKAVAAVPPTIIAFTLFQMILTPLEAFVSIGMNAVSRHFEYEADRFACELESKLKSEDMKDMGDRLYGLVVLRFRNSCNTQVLSDDNGCLFSNG